MKNRIFTVKSVFLRPRISTKQEKTRGFYFSANVQQKQQLKTFFFEITSLKLIKLLFRSILLSNIQRFTLSERHLSIIFGKNYRKTQRMFKFFFEDSSKKNRENSRFRSSQEVELKKKNRNYFQGQALSSSFQSIFPPKDWPATRLSVESSDDRGQSFGGKINSQGCELTGKDTINKINLEILKKKSVRLHFETRVLATSQRDSLQDLRKFLRPKKNLYAFSKTPIKNWYIQLILNDFNLFQSKKIIKIILTNQTILENRIHQQEGEEDFNALKKSTSRRPYEIDLQSSQ